MKVAARRFAYLRVSLCVVVSVSAWLFSHRLGMSLEWDGAGKEHWRIAIDDGRIAVLNWTGDVHLNPGSTLLGGGSPPPDHGSHFASFAPWNKPWPIVTVTRDALYQEVSFAGCGIASLLPISLRVVAVHFWAIVLAEIALFWRIRQRLNHPRGARAPTNVCTQCGYDLRASESRCPECGTAIRAAKPADAGQASLPPGPI